MCFPVIASKKCINDKRSRKEGYCVIVFRYIRLNPPKKVSPSVIFHLHTYRGELGGVLWIRNILWSVNLEEAKRAKLKIITTISFIKMNMHFFM